MTIKVLACMTVALAVFAGDARAEIVVFKNGRTMSVKSCRVEEGTATLRLRTGGEVSFAAEVIERVDPDEVPYPEDAPAVADVAPAPVAPVLNAAAMVPEAVLAARPYANLIAEVAAAHRMDVRLVHAVIEQESNYEPRARSKKGAKGLMQLMPETARQYGVRNSYDPKTNLDAGVRHLKDLMSRLDLPTALAAYNAGEGTVKRYGGLPPYAETQTYVRTILSRLGLPATPVDTRASSN